MTSSRMPTSEDWPTWTLIEVERFESAQDERPFLEVAASLVTEFGELSMLLVQARPPSAEDRVTARNEVILCGLAVRIGKLTRRLVAETYEGRSELQLLLDREIFTSTVTMAYLLRGGAERFEAFVREGLRVEQAVWLHLDKNLELRNGQALPMEQRMRQRLERSFELAALSPDDDVSFDWPSLTGQLDAIGESDTHRMSPPWPPLKDQLAAIGEPDAHRMHQLGADSIHGAWNELLTHHMRYGGDSHVLEPKLEWSSAQVQPLTAVAIQASRVMAAYSRYLSHEVADAFRDKFLDIAGRASVVDRLHEEYLARSPRLSRDEVVGEDR